MPVDRDVLVRTAGLARLPIDEGESERLLDDLSRIIEYVESLSEALETDGGRRAGAARKGAGEAHLRADEEGPTLAADDALGNAPEREGDYLSVPAFLREGG